MDDFVEVNPEKLGYVYRKNSFLLAKAINYGSSGYGFITIMVNPDKMFNVSMIIPTGNIVQARTVI